LVQVRLKEIHESMGSGRRRREWEDIVGNLE